MGIKDILAVVLSAEEDAAVITAAERLAQRFDAHLAATFLTPLPDEPLAYEPTVVAGVWAELLNRARAEAQAEREKVQARLQAFPRACDLRTVEALSRDLGRVAALHARYADLAVLRRPDRDGRDVRAALIEGVLFHSGRPVLVIPPGWDAQSIGARPVIAWDASAEATRAVAEARPLIAGCEMVTVLTVDAKPKAFGHGDQPGAAIAAHFTRRGLPVQVRNAESYGRPIAVALGEEATKLNADLIVMGGYGNARIREMLFGGATHDLLEEASVPLLMAH